MQNYLISIKPIKGNAITFIFSVNFHTSHVLLYAIFLYWQINVKVYCVMQNFYATI
jgi:hypothetical protein